MPNPYRFTAPIHTARVVWPYRMPALPGETVVLIPDPDGGHYGYPLDVYHTDTPYGQPVFGVWLWQTPDNGRYRVYFLHLDTIYNEANRLHALSTKGSTDQTPPTDGDDTSDVAV